MSNPYGATFAELALLVDELHGVIGRCDAVLARMPYELSKPIEVSKRPEVARAISVAKTNAETALLWAHQARDLIEGRPR